MNPYQVRSGARYLGVTIVVATGLAFALLGKLSFDHRGEFSRRQSWLGAPGGRKPPMLTLADPKAALFGSQWTGMELGDLDRDGLGDLLLVEQAARTEVDGSSIARVLVLAPQPDGRAVVLLDSNWARSRAGGEARYWRAERLSRGQLTLRGVSASGEALGLRLMAEWRPGERAFHQRIAFVDPTRTVAYN